MGAFIVTGLVLGSIYAISVLGLVLTYTSSRVFNFAHGAIAYFIAVLLLLAARGARLADPAPRRCSRSSSSRRCSASCLWAVLFRRLTDAPPVVRFVSTVGLWVALPALTKILFPFTKSEIFDPQGLAGRPADGLRRLRRRRST